MVWAWYPLCRYLGSDGQVRNVLDPIARGLLSGIAGPPMMSSALAFVECVIVP